MKQKMLNNSRHRLRLSNPLVVHLCLGYLQTLLFTILTVILLFTFATSLGDLVDGHLPFQIVVFKTFYKIPTIINKALGLICMISAFLTLSQKSQTLELMALESLGIPHTRYFAIIFTLTFLFCSTWFFFSFEYLSPRSEVRLAQISGAKVEVHLRDVAEGNFWLKHNNYYMQFKKLNRVSHELYQLTLYHVKDQNLWQVISSPKAKITHQEILLEDVTIRNTSLDSKNPGQITQLKQFSIAVSKEFLKKVFKPQIDPDKISLSEKLEQLRIQVKLNTPHYILESNLYKNLGLYLSCFSLLLIAFSFTQINARQSNNITQGASCLTIAILYWIAYSILVSLSEAGSISPLTGQILPLAGSVIFSMFKRHQVLLAQ